MKRALVTVVLPLIVLVTVFYFGEVLRSSGGYLYKYIHEFERTEVFDSGAIIEKKQEEEKIPQLLLGQPNRVLEKLNQGKSGKECHIKILIWRKPGEEQRELGLDKWQKATCRNRIPCNIEILYSNILEDIPMSDIVVIMPGPFKNFKWSKLLKARPPGQQWVLYSRESPVHEPQFAPPLALTMENPYNFTATFRSDSDECITWGFYYPGHPSVPAAKRMDWTKGKTKLMTWVASRCDPLGWERTKIVKEIQKFLPVDIYGKCGPLECPKRDKACAKTFSAYKFYLSLENSECKEYFTEKFWNNGFGSNMIPIVYGAPKEDYKRLAPPHSFIHLADFETMEEFVEYIHLLDRNHTLYNEYFHWKAKGGWTSGPGHRTTLSPAGLCTIVKVLKKNIFHPEKSWRFKNPDFHKWWEQTCSGREELLGVRIKVDQPAYMENKVEEDNE
ncbi:Alpha-(1,3)-fucosyltransferase 4 [Holothuria leucospilota]|uniref:Fucosyltransferase n=1 Tax=Holothuria leucospilota TaxID=206669 RepID=A0A9Q1CKU5_HOLLE|nr:Alpha-(1,3)-fucosyltransferase 4 [Holothuria leucospilota]